RRIQTLAGPYFSMKKIVTLTASIRFATESCFIITTIRLKYNCKLKTGRKSKMIKLIKNGEVYAPEKLGKCSILLINNKIIKIGQFQEKDLGSIGLEYEVIDAQNSIITPGFIDPHVHIIGGGGEGGFSTRTPEIQ